MDEALGALEHALHRAVAGDFAVRLPAQGDDALSRVEAAYNELAERNQAVWIVVDCGRLMRARIGSLSKLDFAVDAALNLAQVASFGGDRLALLAYGTRIQERMPPGR